MDEEVVVRTRDLTKRYGSRTLAVDNLNIEVRRGEIYGFLGPNGAGKTTTLRMLLGLVRPTSGSATILGRPPGDSESLVRTGAIVESPAFHPFLSGRDNLRGLARRASLPDARVEEALKMVKLVSRAKDKFSKYSLGMKQRLGVAAALLKDPELLILDEPSNGLDPAGQADMRRLIRTLAGRERTLILSSHNLSEVESLCGRVGVIAGGKLVAEGTVEELCSVGSPRKKDLLIRAVPLEAAARIVRTLYGVEKAKVSDGMLKLTTDSDRAAEINRKLVGAGFEVSELTLVEQSFEEAFLELTGGNTVDDEPLSSGKS